MKKPNKFLLLLFCTFIIQLVKAQCPNGTVVTVTNNAGNNVNGSFFWALDCLDNAGSTLTTVRFDIDGMTEIKPVAVAALVVNKPNAIIEGNNQGSGGAIIIDGTAVAGPSSNGLILGQPGISVQDLIIRNFTASAGGNGILDNSNNSTVTNNTLIGNRIGIATGSNVFNFNISSNTIGANGTGNISAGIAAGGNPTAGVIANNDIAHNNGNGITITGGNVLITDNSIYCNLISGITRPSPPLPPNITFSTTQEIRGTSTPNSLVEVFIHSTTGCAAAPVQGKTFIGLATTPASGPWVLQPPLGSVNPGSQVTATSTVNNINTSAFSGPASVTDCSTFSAGITSVNISCQGANNGSATATPTTPSLNYLWGGGETTATISNLSPGDYTVTVTNPATGCTASQTVSITEPPALNLTLTPVNVSCFGGNNGSATSTAGGGTPGYTYLWSNGQTTPGASNLAAGNYTVTVTDQNFCTASQTVTISQPGQLSVSVGMINPVSCFGGSNGSATATPVGGTSAYTYLWSNGQTNNKAMNLVAGIYTVTTTDMNLCTATQTVTITQPALLLLNVSATGESTAGAADGSASASANGGTAPFTYQWSSGQSMAQIFNLIPGTYTVTVTDQNSCSSSKTAIVTAGSSSGACMALPVYAILGPAQVCGNTSFNLEADDLYPNPVVKYVWRLPNGDTIVTSQPTLEITATSSDYSGEYFVLRDSAGCRSIPVGGAIVMVLTLDNVFAGNDVVLCSAAQVQLMANPPASGTGSWVSLGAAVVANPAQNQSFANNLQSGANVFVWKISLGNCPQAAADTVVFFVENRPTVRDDHYTLQHAFDVAVMEVLLNDALGGLTDTMLIQLNAPANGQLELLEATNRFRYTVAEDFRGTVTFQYAVCNTNSLCNLPCDTATVTIDVQNLPTVPTGLVLEDSGPNGAFTIRGINGFSRVEISITNRWGDLVFQEKDYSNETPWLGNYKRSGNYLPGGAYYYFLKAYDGDKQIGGTLTGVVHLFEK